MRYAVVELKYMPKKTFIVPINWIKNYIPTQLPTVPFLCYISTNLKDDPNFLAKYYKNFNGTAGLFKVFILTVKDCLIDAVSFQEQKRIKSIPHKFRQPENTDAELNAENAKRRKKENIVKKGAQQNAKVKNMAHLAAILDNAVSNNISDQNPTQEMDDHNVQFTDSEEKHIEMSLLFGAEIYEQPTVQVGSSMTQKPHNDTQIHGNEIQMQPIIVSVDLSGQMNTAKIRPNVATGMESQLVTITETAIQPYEAFCNVPPNDTIVDVSPNGTVPDSIFQTEIQRQECLFYDSAADEVPPNVSVLQSQSESKIQNEHPSVTKKCSHILQLAMDGLHGIDFGELDFTNGFDTNVEVVDLPVIGTHSGTDQDKLDLGDNSPSSTSFSVPIQQNYGKESTSAIEERSGVAGREIDYKKAYLQQKEINASLDERNSALQNALVAADKALGKVPQVPFTAKDGGRLYKVGVFLNATQCKVLDATSDSNKYVNNLAVSIFGTEVLKQSSVTGTSSKNKALPAKPGLNPLWLQLIYDLTDAKTNKRLSKADINKILNKKISNLIGAEKRSSVKLNAPKTGSW